MRLNRDHTNGEVKICLPISYDLMFFQKPRQFSFLRHIRLLNVQPITLHVDGHATLELVEGIKNQWTGKAKKN